MTVLRYSVAAIMVLACASTILSIGKPREPITPGVALGSVILVALVVCALVVR